MKIQTTLKVGLIAGPFLLFLAACRPEKGAETSQSPDALGTSAQPPSSFLLADAPDIAPSLLEALGNPGEGDSIIFTGRVGGVRDPLSTDFALFIVADEVLEFCDETPGDQCTTPWDACCEDPEKIVRSRAVVQFVDAAGEPLAVNLTQAIGLAANDLVMVKGRLAPDSDRNNPIILAEGIALRR